MGVDITMNVVKDGKVLAKDLYDGRNYEFFDNLQGHGYDDVYDKLCVDYGLPESVPEDWHERYTKQNYYYGFAYISVGDFKKWYERYRPDIDAGYFTCYERWKILKRGYDPNLYNIKHYLDKEDIIEDMYFMEVENKYDPARVIYNALVDEDLPDDATLVYWFDC